MGRQDFYVLQVEKTKGKEIVIKLSAVCEGTETNDEKTRSRHFRSTNWASHRFHVQVHAAQT
jgi:hypothetical protein